VNESVAAANPVSSDASGATVPRMSQFTSAMVHAAWGLAAAVAAAQPAGSRVTCTRPLEVGSIRLPTRRNPRGFEVRCRDG
jgi:hypothetical protein